MRIREYYKYLPLFLLLLIFVVKSTSFPIHDFANYYFGGYFVSINEFNSQIYFPHIFNLKIASLNYKNMFVSFAPNTPFLAILFSPLSYIKIAYAKLIFNFISCLALIVSLRKLEKFYNISYYFICLIPILFFIPFKNNILFGQVYFILFWLLTEFWINYNKGKNTTAIIYLGVAIMLKLTPLIFVFIFLFKKDFKTLIKCAVICLLLLLFSISITGLDIWLFWLKEIFTRASKGEIAGLYVDNYQSFFMFLKRLLVYHPTQNDTTILDNPQIFNSIISSVKIICILFGFALMKQKNNLLILSYWILISVLLSPYGSTYGLTILLFVLIYTIKRNASIKHKIIVCSLIFAINNIPTNYFINLTYPISYLRLLLFILLAIILIRKMNFNKRFGKVLLFSPILILLVSFFFNHESKEEARNIESNGPILLYDYSLSDKNMLTYKYWDNKGENLKKLRYTLTSVKKLELIDNQIYLKDKQITFTNDNKLKPLLIDNSKILFLSDHKRGFGFYTLKEIKL